MEYWSDDRRFGLRISQEEFLKILSNCAANANQETGGILIGTYTDDHHCAEVTIATIAPPDSGRAHSAFFRGFQGLTEILKELWKRREYYLGEWHFHPFASPNPSHTDQAQMRIFSETPSYHCPEPVMLIVGGDPNKKWKVKVFVFPKGEMIEMRLMEQGKGANGAGQKL